MNREDHLPHDRHPAVSVVIPTYNRRELLLRQLDSLFQQNLPSDSYEIVVVNDGSTDGTSDAIRSRLPEYPNLKLLDLSNCGPAAARNAGARAARGRVLVFTDDDCVATPLWLQEILRPFQDPDVVAVQGRTTTDARKRTPLTHQIEVLGLSSALPTCNVAYLRQAYSTAGGFDTRFRYPHNEDTDLAWRILPLGKVVFAPAAHIDHPPRQDPFLKHLQSGKHLESEFALFYKHPATYATVRYSSPWLTIYWRVYILGQISLFRSSFRYLVRPFRPHFFPVAIFLLVSRWVNMIRFFPYYRQASTFYQGVFDPAKKQSAKIHSDSVNKT